MKRQILRILSRLNRRLINILFKLKAAKDRVRFILQRSKYLLIKKKESLILPSKKDFMEFFDPRYIKFKAFFTDTYEKICEIIKNFTDKFK